MREVLISYIQFLYYAVHENALLFLLVLLGVPSFWLLAKLANILHEESALKLSSFVFFTTSVIAVVLLCLQPSPQEYYRPLLFLLTGVLTFLFVSPIYGENPDFDIKRKRRVIILDGISHSYESLMQIHLKRCFTRTKRSCLIEVDYVDETSRPRTLYYETNDVAGVRKLAKKLRTICPFVYDTAFSRFTIEIPFFSLTLKTVLLSVCLFGLILPASSEIKEKAQEKVLPKYSIVKIPADLYKPQKNILLQDYFEPIFKSDNIQIVLFDGPYSSHFVGNYRKALYSVLNQNYDFNIVFVNARGLTLKHSREPKVYLSTSSENVYTKFVVDNCKKLCFIDNTQKAMYSTEIETVDPRALNVQEAINMYGYVSEKNIEEKQRQAAKRQAEERRLAELEAAEAED